MDQPTAIELAELAELADAVLHRVANRQKTSVRLTRDLYWCVAKEEKYHAYDEPSSFTIGQLSEDIENLRRTAIPDDDYLPANALIWLGRLIEAVGEELTP